MMELMFKNSQSGQTGVIILLLMAGMLTVGLSLATQTTQEALLSGKETDSARVFNAAEEGIEQAISSNLEFTGDTFSGTVANQADISVAYTVTKKNTLEVLLFEGVSVSVDVTGAQDGNVLQIDWSKVDDCGSDDLASLLVATYSDVSGVARTRYTYVAGCDRSDGFESAQNIDENDYRRRYNLTLQTGDTLVRIKPIYADTNINVTSSGFVLPVQYYAIRSEASRSESNETRIVEVNRTLSAAPSIFDFAIYSGNTLIK